MTRKKTVSAVVAMALAIAMMASSVVSFAAIPTRQTNSSDDATITLEKTLTARANKFPDVEDFTFELERVKAWDNANVDTTKQGAEIAKANIPMPAASETEHHTVTVSGDKATVKAGNYKVAGTGDTSTTRTRSTAVPINDFTKAGYYVYKVSEKNDGVVGIKYDKDSYYLVVYVANNVDADNNTTSGVYVHSITVWQNEPASLADITNLNAADVIGNPDIGTNPDNTGDKTSTKGNTPYDTPSGEGKVGLSTEADPDAITVNFKNLSEAKDINISKDVKGTLGDTTKEFEFTVTLANLEANKTYQLSDTVSIKGTPTAGTYDSTAHTITATATGTATFVAKLKDGENLCIEALPVGATYTVSEAASDHIASLAVTSDSNEDEFTYTAVNVEDMDSSKTYYYENDGTDTEVDQANIEAGTTEVYEKVANANAPIIAGTSKANSAKNTALASEQETVDASDGNITVAYTNTRDLATVTGVSNAIMAMMAAAALLLAAGFIFMKKRNSYEED